MSNPTPQSEALLHPALENPSGENLFRDTEALPPLRPLWSIVVVIWLVRFSAVLNLVSSLIPSGLKLFHWLGHWLPFEISEGRHLRMFLVSMLLFILASGLKRGKRAAWLATIVTLAVVPFLHFGREVIWPQVAVNLTFIGILLLHRQYFVARSDKTSVQSALIICPLLALLLLVFGTIRLHDLRDETSGDDGWLACTQTAFELVLAQETDTQQAQTSASISFFGTLRTSGTLIALVGLVLMLRPVLIRQRVLGENRERARRIVEHYGHDPFDSYALLNDKRYLFTADNQAVVPYVLSRSIAVALADPIGLPEMRPMAVADFVGFCRRQDWEPVFYAVTEELIPYYKQAGLSVFKIGEGARVQAENFHLKGQDFQNLRTLCHRAQRLGIRFRWYDAGGGVDESLENQLTVISQRWLEMKKAREMTFDMGSFSVEDIRRNGAAVAIDSKGTPLAFATWRPFAQGTGRALDLMRTLPHARNIMDFVLVESILHFKSTGITQINLGLAPLANTKEAPSRLVAEEKVVQFLFENLNHVYGYKSLFDFKRKYRPQWRGRYLAYRRGVHLPLIGLALVRVHAAEGLWRFLFR